MAGILLWIVAPVGDWRPLSLVVVLFALAFAGDLLTARTVDHSRPAVRLSPLDLAVVPAMVYLGPLPAALTALLGTAADALAFRSERGRKLQLAESWIDLVWPAAGSAMFFALAGASPDQRSATFVLFAAGAAITGIIVNAALVVVVQAWLTPVERGGGGVEFRYLRQTVVMVEAPLLLASIGVVIVYAYGGLWSLLLVVSGLTAFLWLRQKLALLRSREVNLQVAGDLLTSAREDTLVLLADTMAKRDLAAARHSAAVGRWALDLARASGCDEATQRSIHTAAVLHDIGKLALPDTLLFHDGGLSEKQQRLFKAHTEDGANLIAWITGFESVAEMIRHHHERVDGTGYPDRLSGDGIPLGARIIAVCEAYDVMTARDSYRAPLAPEEAIAELRRRAGTRFDHAIVERFVELLLRADVTYRHGDDDSFGAQSRSGRRGRDRNQPQPPPLRGMVHAADFDIRPARAGYVANALALISAPVAVVCVGVVAVYGLGGSPVLSLMLVALLVLGQLMDQLILLVRRERELETRNWELATFHLGVLGLLTATLADRDRLTARHSAAVSRWACDLAAASGCDTEEQWRVRTAGLVHDIGKFALPDVVLFHDGELSDAQRLRLRAHATQGAELVGRVTGLEPIAPLVRHHHERFDGTGYPDGLKGEQIPLGARILAVCEAYDAMTARDSYRAPVAPSQAIAELRASAGTAFDPVLVRRFGELLEVGAPQYRHGEAVSFQKELDAVLADNHALAHHAMPALRVRSAVLATRDARAGMEEGPWPVVG